MNVNLLCDASFPLVDGSGRLGVPEPVIKRWLRQLNGADIPTPEGVSLPAGDAGLSLAHAAWVGLREPLVLKAFGPSIASGAELGATRLGLSADEVVGAISAMGHELSARTHGRRGYYVEEQQPPGIELRLDVSRGPDGSTTVSLAGASRSCTGPAPCPITADDAERMLSEALEESLGEALVTDVDRAACLRLLLAVAGPGTPEVPSVVDALGAELQELAFDPFVAMPVGVCVLDARLILAPR
jgi:hypothetical protein